jgi:hypothetical protein
MVGIVDCNANWTLRERGTPHVRGDFIDNDEGFWA